MKLSSVLQCMIKLEVKPTSITFSINISLKLFPPVTKKQESNVRLNLLFIGFNSLEN